MATTESHQNLFARILAWLRAGYPEGIPHTDHVALMGLLHRSLTETEVRHIAEELAADDVGLLDREQVADAISEHVLEKASDSDIDRVAARLVAGGLHLARTGAAGHPGRTAGDPT